MNKYNCNVIFSDSILSQRGEVGVDSFKRSFDGVTTLIVHADANDDADAFEVISSIFSTLAQLAQVMQQPVCRFKIAELVL